MSGRVIPLCVRALAQKRVSLVCSVSVALRRGLGCVLSLLWGSPHSSHLHLWTVAFGVAY